MKRSQQVFEAGRAQGYIQTNKRYRRRLVPVVTEAFRGGWPESLMWDPRVSYEKSKSTMFVSALVLTFLITDLAFGVLVPDVVWCVLWPFSFRS